MRILRVPATSLVDKGQSKDDSFGVNTKACLAGEINMLPTETDFEAEVSMETEAIPIPEDPPFLILFAGDFSGRKNLSSLGGEPENSLRPIEIDRDNFDDVFRKLKVTLRIEAGGPGTGFLPLTFESLDDFHPDSIFNQVPLFRDLRQTRQRLLDPSQFDQASREVRGWLDEEEPGDEGSAPAPAPARERALETGDLLEDILGSTKRDAEAYPAKTTDDKELRRLIRDLVRPHLISTDEAEQSKLLNVVDGMTGDLMRGIVHHPEFKELEAIWRGLYLVVRGVETSSDLKVYLYDISKQELASDLRSVGDLADSAFHRIAVRESADETGGEPWALVCGAFDFAMNVDDAATLMRIAAISKTVKAPFVSHVRPDMLGIRSLAEHPVPSSWNTDDGSDAGTLWTTLRTFPEAPSLGMALPRFLGRLPYGAETDPTEAFHFEELSESRSHDDYLWVNPAFACALLLARSYRACGWEFGGRYHLDIEGLPTHVFSEKGETRTKPCAEIAMTHEACDKLIEEGLMPLISFKDTDRVRLGGFQSIAFPSKDLDGRWS